MPLIKPNAFAPVGPDTITVTFSGIPATGIIASFVARQIRNIQPLFGLQGANAILFTTPALGTAQFNTVVLPADTSSSANLTAFVNSFTRPSCGAQTITITANFSCGGSGSTTVVLNNARITGVNGAIRRENFLFISQIIVNFSSFG
jgi:hypothetical protein